MDTRQARNWRREPCIDRRCGLDVGHPDVCHLTGSQQPVAPYSPPPRRNSGRDNELNAALPHPYLRTPARADSPCLRTPNRAILSIVGMLRPGGSSPSPFQGACVPWLDCLCAVDTARGKARCFEGHGFSLPKKATECLRAMCGFCIRARPWSCCKDRKTPGSSPGALERRLNQLDNPGGSGQSHDSAESRTSGGVNPLNSRIGSCETPWDVRLLYQGTTLVVPPKTAKHRALAPVLWKEGLTNSTIQGGLDQATIQ
jgi:hypothetical protein